MNLVSLLFHDVYVQDEEESGFSSPAANRYKLTLGDFEAQLAGIASVRPTPPLLASDLSRSDRPGLALSITVDDGGVSYYTLVADRLEALGWRGHCFVTTDLIGTRGFLTSTQIRELSDRGHLIGSHSASHPQRFSMQTLDDMRREWVRSREVLQDLLGRPVTVASVPGGYFSRRVAQSACEAGLDVLFTSEPTTRLHRLHECVLPGRFTLRRGCRADAARRLVESSWARSAAWANWNAKGVVKPILGASYVRVADWLLADKSPASRDVS